MKKRELIDKLRTMTEEVREVMHENGISMVEIEIKANGSGDKVVFLVGEEELSWETCYGVLDAKAYQTLPSEALECEV